MSKATPFQRVEGEEIMTLGNGSCQGCGHATLARITFKVLGKNTVYTSVPGCIWIALQEAYPFTGEAQSSKAEAHSSRE